MERKNTGIIKTLVILLAAIGVGIAIVPRLLVLILVLILSPDLIDVGRDINILSVYGSHGDAGALTERLAVSNGKDTFIYDDGCLCQYIDDDNIITIKVLGEQRLDTMAITDKYLLYYTYGHTYRYDIETGEEVSILDDIYVEQITAIDNTFFITTDHIGSDSPLEIYNYLVILEGDDVKGIEIPIDTPQQEYGETHIEFISMYTTVYEEYCIYIGDMPGSRNSVLAVEKDGELYSFWKDAIFIVDGHMVTMDDGRYMYNGVSYGIQGIREEKMRHYACMSSQYNDDIYTVVRKGTGYTMEYANPIAVEDEYLVKISPTCCTEEVLYKADNKTRIVGFNVETNKVYLINDKDLIYMQDLETNAKENIVKLDSSVGKLYFEWCNNKLFVFEYDDGYKLIGSY